MKLVLLKQFLNKNIADNFFSNKLICLVVFAFVMMVWPNRVCFAQTKQDLKAYLQAGDELYAQENYLEAKKYYALAAKFYTSDGQSAYQLAQCHEKLFEYAKAEEWYGKSYEREKDKYLLALLQKANMQKANGNTDSTQKSLDEFIRLYEPVSVQDSLLLRRALIESESLELINQESQKPKDAFGFEVLGSPINSKYAEYGACFLKSDSFIVVSSHRPSAKLTDNRSGFYFSDNFVFERKKQSWVERPGFQNFDITNTPVNDGAGNFALNNTKYYYTSCHESDGKCKIYVSEKKDGRWQKPIALANTINLAGSETKHPSLSASGDTLFFVSNRPGGLGQNDIWYSIRQNQTEDWSAATNLGPAVNTAFEEVSPFFDNKEKILFFSSTGYKGMGGLDIYMSRMDQANGFGPVSNLGVPFNSNRDDFFFVIHNKAGMLTSNREGRVQNYDIYSFKASSRMELLASMEANSLKNVIASTKPVKRRALEDEEQLENQKQQLYSQVSTEEKDKIRRLIAWRKATSGYSESGEDGMKADSIAFSKLSIEEQNKVVRIAAAMPVKEYYSLDPELKQADQQFYASLDGQEKDKIERFIFRNMAGNIREQDAPLQQYDKQFWATLSLEERIMIDRLASSRLSKHYYSGDPSLMARDEKFYKALPADVKSRIERMVGLRENKSVYSGGAVGLRQEDQNFMKNLSSAERNRISRLVALKHKQKIYPDEALEKKEQLWPSSLPTEQSLAVQRLTDARIASWLYEQDKVLLKADKLWYQTLNAEEKTRLDRLGALRLAKLSGQDDAKIKAADQQWLNQLKSIDRDRIGRIVANRNNAYINGAADLGLAAAKPSRRGNKTDSVAFSKLSIEEQSRVARIAAGMTIKEYYSQDPELKQADQQFYAALDGLEKERIERFIFRNMAGNIREQDAVLQQFDKQFYNTLSPQERTMIERLAGSRLSKYYYNADPSLMAKDEKFYKSLPADVKSRIERMIGLRKNKNVYDGAAGLREEDMNYMKNLSSAEKDQINRLVALKHKQKLYPDERLEKQEQFWPTSLPTEESLAAQRLIDAQVTSWLYGQDKDLLEADKLWYQTLTPEEKTRLDRLSALRTAQLSGQDDAKLKAADQKWLNQLGSLERDKINRVLSNRKNGHINKADDSQLATSAADKYNWQNVSPELKDWIERQARSTKTKSMAQINDRSAAEPKENYEIKPLQSENLSEVARLIEAKAKNRSFQDNSALRSVEEAFYQSLSSEDKKQIGVRVKSRIINQMISQDLSLEKSGFDYSNLSSDNKAKIDRIIESRLGKDVYGKDIDLRDADQMYFKGLLPPHRNALNRLIATKKAGYTSPVDELDLSENDKMAYNQLNLLERQRIDRLIRSLMGENAYSRDPTIKEADDLYYSQLAIQEKEWINRLTEARKKLKNKYTEDPVAGTQEQDKTFYYNLTSKDKQRIDRLAATQLGKDVYTQNPALRKEDQTYMSGLKPEEKQSMSSVISSRNAGKFMLSDEALSRNTHFGRPALYGRIYFDKNSTSVRVDAYKFLDNVAEFLRANPGKKLYIYAHSDSYGDKAYNQDLSDKRAKNVRNYITEKGLKVEIVVPQGEGEAFPVAPNTTAAGRQLNRRAEFFIVD